MAAMPSFSDADPRDTKKPVDSDKLIQRVSKFNDANLHSIREWPAPDLR